MALGARLQQPAVKTRWVQVRVPGSPENGQWRTRPVDRGIIPEGEPESDAPALQGVQEKAIIRGQCWMIGASDEGDVVHGALKRAVVHRPRGYQTPEVTPRPFRGEGSCHATALSARRYCC